jgi:MFS family permease
MKGRRFILKNKTTLAKRAFLFLLLLGFISLLSDFTHEGARSIYGQYLGLIGVSAFLVSFTSGLGEFIGQALRVFTGIIADKTRKYWLMLIIGYAVNLLAIPLLGLVDASIWQVAIVLILLERVGKAIRAPAKSALTSFTAPYLGAGKAFAILEALDQFGAFLGPLFVFAILGTQNEGIASYQLAFGCLGIFAILTLVIIAIARMKYPHPDEFETKTIEKGFRGNPVFIVYMIAIGFIAMGFVDFPVIAYYVDGTGFIDVLYVPLLYSLAMGVDAVSALVFGHLFDKIGIRSLIIAMAIAMFSVPFVFLGDGLVPVLGGVVLWGVGMGAQESILKSVVATVVSKEKRATSYGIFSSVFGLAWFVGSAIVGLLYDVSLVAIVVFTMLMEGCGLVTLFILMKMKRQTETAKVE